MMSVKKLHYQIFLSFECVKLEENIKSIPSTNWQKSSRIGEVKTPPHASHYLPIPTSAWRFNAMENNSIYFNITRVILRYLSLRSYSSAFRFGLGGLKEKNVINNAVSTLNIQEWKKLSIACSEMPDRLLAVCNY